MKNISLNLFNFLMISGFILVTSLSASVNVAIIDSGVDIEHKDFTDSIWINQDEVAGNWRDDDGNLYPDDIYGWNFAENNPFVIDRKYIGTFSNDPYKFFDIQGKLFFDKATQEEKDWLAAKRKDKKFAKEMGKFGNFVHGTHVAGIGLGASEDINIQAIKLIPTEVKPFIKELSRQVKLHNYVEERGDDWRKKLMTQFFNMMAEQQAGLMGQIALYLKHEDIQIANGSFGSGYRQLSKVLTDVIYRVLHFKKPTKEQSEATAKILLEAMVREMRIVFAQADQTFFVFAAGNDGLDNDYLPTSPASINLENSIAVAATYNDLCIAPFSNFGAKSVDIAAPGMIIKSQIPGNEYLRVSGTSQAAPYVAHVAASVQLENAELMPKQIKQILMGTVDYKEFLKGKVLSEGLVNKERAQLAAKMSLEMPLEEAISLARKEVKDQKMKSEFTCQAADKVEPLALFPNFR
ncbi:S8 family serine peptidase [Bacteriovoracaceae bacterium]|nr:S8 family serine peptidase [Bacteriovoracaceae bacterium]